MSASSAQILSRDELGALLDSIAAERTDREKAGLPFRSLARTDSDQRDQHPSIASALERFAARLGKEFSTRFQARIDFELLSWQQMRVREVQELMLEKDGIVTFRENGSGGSGFVYLNHPFAYQWLALSMGAGFDMRVEIPDRPHTPIEQSFLKHAAAQLLASLGEALDEYASLDASIESYERASVLSALDDLEVSLLSFDVQGLDGIGRLRFALPGELLTPSTRVPSQQGPEITQQLLQLPLELRVAAGEVEIPLSRMSRLAVGDVIPIEGSFEEVTLLVEGAPKFRGQRGQSGGHLAVRVTSRIPG